MSQTIRSAACCGLVLLAAAPAFAWGPRAQLALVGTAANLAGKQQNIPLARLNRDVVDGASLARTQLVEIMPELANDPLRAIEAEVYLLQAVKPERIDPYYAYRLGTLGKLIAEATTPLATVDAGFRDLFFADVERAIDDLALSPTTPDIVEPVGYLNEVIVRQNQRNALIEQEYRAGSGFDGIAKNALQEYATTTVDAIGDLWYTILGSGSRAAVSQEQLSNYASGAVAYYASRDNVAELDAAVERLGEVLPLTPDLKMRFAEVYTKAGKDDRAIKLYKEVAAADPSRRDVTERIAEYYVRQGRAALEAKDLESALEDFAEAVTANPLHPSAERERLEVAKLIDARHERLEASRAALREAEELRALAEQEAMNKRYAESIALTRQALDRLGTVEPEFPAEFQTAQTAARQLQQQTREMREQLVQNAQSFSGSAIGQDVRAVAREQASALSRATLEALEEQARKDQMQLIAAQVEPSLNEE